MATTRNIQMQYFNGTDYDTLYPYTTNELIGSLPITGGTMTGNLVLNGDPTSNLMAASKQYVDNVRTTIQQDIFFDKLLEKEYQVNFVFKGSSRLPSGIVATGLQSEISELLPEALFFINNWNLNITGNMQSRFSFGLSADSTSINYELENKYDYKNSGEENILISTFNSFTCYDLEAKFSYINNSHVSLEANSFNCLKASDYDTMFQGTITGTVKITFYGIN